MTWPSTPGFSTGNVDNAGDSPASARADIKNLMDDVGDMIAARGSASGVASLDSGGKVPLSQLPASVTSPTTAIQNDMLVYNTPGTYSFVASTDMRIKYDLVGGGGGGSNGYVGPSGTGVGGGAGGRSVGLIDVLAGQTVEIIVGTGGAGGTGAGSSTCNGQDGTYTQLSVNGTMKARAMPGKGGNIQPGSVAPGIGGSVQGSYKYWRAGDPGVDIYGGTNEHSGFNITGVGVSFGGGGGCGVVGVLLNGWAGLNGLAILEY